MFFRYHMRWPNQKPASKDFDDNKPFTDKEFKEMMKKVSIANCDMRAKLSKDNA